jgi:hypothetical protein
MKNVITRVCICMQNYQITKITKITKLQIASAFLLIYKFAHAKFAHFDTCIYYKIIDIYTYKFPICKVCKLDITKLQNCKWKMKNYNLQITMFSSLQVQ